MNKNAVTQWMRGSYFEGDGAFLQSPNRIFKTFLLKDGNVCVMSADRKYTIVCLNTTRLHLGQSAGRYDDGLYFVSYEFDGRLCMAQRLVG